MATVIAIDDPADPRVAPYRAIRERDLVRRDGLFIAEGRVVIEKMIASPIHAPLSLLVAAHRLDSIAAIVAALPDDCPVLAAGQAVMDAVAGFNVHRGLLAIGRRTAVPGASALIASLGDGPAIVVALGAIANTDNMGGIFRNAAAFGVDAVLIDADCCDPLYRKAIRVSVGASLLVPFARLERGADWIALAERHGLTPVALSPTGGIAIEALAPPARAMLLLGAEGPGLDPALMARAASVRIDMAGGFDSLNVATTSGIALHHLTRLTRPAR